MRHVAYDLQTVNTPNPIARFAHRARLKSSIAHASRLVGPSGTVLDFGCGTGTFLNALYAERHDINPIGYDPYMSPSGFQLVNNLLEVPGASVDLVTCLEVLEHLSDTEVADFVEHTTRILKRDGFLLASVPIIGGPTLILKEANRMILHRRRSEYGLSELLKCAFLGTPAPRPTNRRPTHKGFDFSQMRSILLEHFTLKDAFFCPFPRLPWWLNSQAFFLMAQPLKTGLVDH